MEAPVTPKKDSKNKHQEAKIMHHGTVFINFFNITRKITSK